MHVNAKEWDLRNAARFEKAGVLPMGRPCDWCGEPVNMGYLHFTCTWVELEALNKEASARALVRKKQTGRRGTVTRVYGKYAKEALTPRPPESKLRGNKESSHEAISLSPEGQ